MLLLSALRVSALALVFMLLFVGPAVAPAAPGTGGFEPTVVVVGDSLAVGMEPYLDAMLPGRNVRWDAKMGRTTPQGLVALRALLRERSPQAVGISLGTNDGSDPRRFRRRIARVLDAIPPSACVVWANLNRPPRKGAYGQLNAVLRDIGRRVPRLRLIDWDQAVRSGHVRLPDHLHPDDAGFMQRSRMYARALDDC